MAQRGMFGDGFLYATIARNLSIGSGSFWAPRYTETAWTAFYEHPPLGLALEAAAFAVFGDHLIVERAFSLIVFGLHALVIAAIWRRMQPAALDWLPLLFWLLPSIVTWGAVNNMLENTQALFTSLAVLLLLAAIRAPDSAASVMRSAAAGVAIVAAVLTKGPVGLYPLAAPLLIGLLPDTPPDTAAPQRSGPRQWPRSWPWPSPSRVMTVTLTSCLVVAAFGIALAAYPPSRHNLTTYFGQQLASSVQGLREVSEPLALVRHVVIGIVGRMTALLALFWWFGRQRWAAPDGRALCFLVLGLCAAGPIAISPKVAGHYFLPAIPMFALGFASIASGFIASHLRPRPIAIVMFTAASIVALVFTFGRGASRDAAMLHEIDAIEHAMPRDITIGACRHERSSRDWGLHTYTQRWFRVSLDARDMPINGWLLREGDDCQAPSSCSPVARGETLTLFRCPESRHQTSQ
jgi:4-amino-4-deoxy-L-arabinose transferase-like glycosyltransferase